MLGNAFKNPFGPVGIGGAAGIFDCGVQRLYKNDKFCVKFTCSVNIDSKSASEACSRMKKTFSSNYSYDIFDVFVHFDMLPTNLCISETIGS